MKVFIVAPNGSKDQNAAVEREQYPNILLSYAYKNCLPKMDGYIQRMFKAGSSINLTIDSGAFTAFSSGKPVKPIDYFTWACDVKAQYSHAVNELLFMNLDVIGDQEGTWKNYEFLTGKGLNVVPIVTCGCDPSHIQKALAIPSVIALGGLVPYSRKINHLRRWLDSCFRHVLTQRHKTGNMPRIHLLGVTAPWVLNRYPAFSSDSSSWTQSLRYSGGVQRAIKTSKLNVKGLPRSKEGIEGFECCVHVLRQEIRRCTKMEQEATSLWKARGITWE